MQTTTFGDFPAASQLATLLDERNDPVLTKKVSRVLQDFNVGLHILQGIADTHYRGRMALLWRDDFLSRSVNDPEVDQFLRNVITTRAKQLLANYA